MPPLTGNCKGALSYFGSNVQVHVVSMSVYSWLTTSNHVCVIERRPPKAQTFPLLSLLIFFLKVLLYQTNDDATEGIRTDDSGGVWTGVAILDGGWLSFPVQFQKGTKDAGVDRDVCFGCEWSRFASVWNRMKTSNGNQVVQE
jgi:hypothetical protein